MDNLSVKFQFGGESPQTIRARCSGFRSCICSVSFLPYTSSNSSLLSYLNNAMHPNTLSRGEGVSEADGSGMRVEIIDLPLCRRLFAMFYCTPFHPLSPPPREGVWCGALFESGR